MFKAVDNLLAALEDLKASNRELLSVFRDHLKVTADQVAMQQQEHDNTARKRHAAQMRAWRAAHDKLGRFVKNATKPQPATNGERDIRVERLDLDPAITPATTNGNEHGTTAVRGSTEPTSTKLPVK